VTDVVAVLDTSPLISFHQIGRLELLQSLFDVIVAPPAVAHEISPLLGMLPWQSSFLRTLSCWMTLLLGEKPCNLGLM
jgi:predicted nucleic acid-binding protein